ncbi:MAG: hypothetical protein AAFS10_25965, partial [Myxococcota bacterium]
LNAPNFTATLRDSHLDPHGLDPLVASVDPQAPLAHRLPPDVRDLFVRRRALWDAVTYRKPNALCAFLDGREQLEQSLPDDDGWWRARLHLPPWIATALWATLGDNPSPTLAARIINLLVVDSNADPRGYKAAKRAVVLQSIERCHDLPDTARHRLAWAIGQSDQNRLDETAVQVWTVHKLLTAEEWGDARDWNATRESYYPYWGPLSTQNLSDHPWFHIWHMEGAPLGLPPWCTTAMGVAGFDLHDLNDLLDWLPFEVLEPALDAILKANNLDELIGSNHRNNRGRNTDWLEYPTGTRAQLQTMLVRHIAAVGTPAEHDTLWRWLNSGQTQRQLWLRRLFAQALDGGV